MLNFRFPLNDKALLAEWTQAVNREGTEGKAWVPTKNHTLCSDHFVVTDYQVRPGAEKKHLRVGTVPSVFSTHPLHLQVNRHSSQ